MVFDAWAVAVEYVKCSYHHPNMSMNTYVAAYNNMSAAVDRYGKAYLFTIPLADDFILEKVIINGRLITERIS